MFSLGFKVETEIQLGFDDGDFIKVHLVILGLDDGGFIKVHLLMLGFRVEMEVLLGFDDGRWRFIGH